MYQKRGTIDIVLMLILLGTVAGQLTEPTPNSLSEFEQKPTGENFAALVADGQGTTQQLLSLPPSEQRRFLELADYGNPRVRVIAGTYFAQSVANVNSNKNAFVTYMQAKDIPLVEFSGDIVSYSTTGLLQTKDGSVNINDFREGNLKDSYSLAIVNGKIHLIPKGSSEPVEVTGDLKRDKNTGNLEILKGTISGRTITRGKDIRITNTGITGVVMEINGVQFASPSIVSLDNSNVLKLANAEITSVRAGTNLFIEGSATVKNYKSIHGNFKVKPRKSFTLNNINIQTGGNEVELRFGQNNNLLADLQSNFVSFSDTLQVNGWVTVKVSEYNMRNHKKSNDQSFVSINDPPNYKGRSWFKVGDNPPESSPAYDQIVDLKKALNAWHETTYNKPFFSEEELEDGVFSSSTASLVKIFQESYNRQNPGQRIKADGVWGKNSLQAYQGLTKSTNLNTDNIIIESRGGASTILDFKPRQGIHIDSHGDATLIVGNKQFRTRDDQTHKEIGRTIAAIMNTDVQINFVNRDGSVRDTITAKSTDYLAKQLQADICMECSLHTQMDLDSARCAEFVRRDLAIRLVGTELADQPVIELNGETKTVSEVLGFVGSGSWRLGHNIKGDTMFKQENSFSPEEQRLLFEVEKAVRQKFSQLQQQGLPNEVIRSKLKEDDISLLLPPDLREQYRGKNLQQIHDTLLGRTPSFDVTKLQDYDYIGLYHLGSNYLSTASLNGKTVENERLQDSPTYTISDSMQNNRHTHSANGYWGKSAEHTYDYSRYRRLSLTGFLKREYNIRDTEALQYLGRVYVEDSTTGTLRQAKITTDGNYYFVRDLDEKNNPLPGRSRIVLKEDTVIEVQPYMVRHLDGKIHDEPLAKAVDQKNSVYLVKRPNQQLLREVIKQAGLPSEVGSIQIEKQQSVEDVLREMNIPEENLPKVAEHVRKINRMNSNELHEGDVIKIPTPEIVQSAQLSISDNLRQTGISNPEHWAEIIRKSTQERLQEYDISPEHRRDFERLTAGIIQRESRFGISKRYKFKSNVEKILPEFINPFGSKGYAQIDIETARELALQHGEELNPSELSSPQGSVKYAQRRLAEAFEIYAKPGQPLSKADKEIIATTYNSGVMRPRNTALQKQLQDLGFFPKNVEVTGTVGPATLQAFKSFAAAENIKISEEEIQRSLGKSQRTAFENSPLYERLKQQWQAQKGTPPAYATIPELTTEKLYTGKLTASNYGKAVVSFIEG